MPWGVGESGWQTAEGPWISEGRAGNQHRPVYRTDVQREVVSREMARFSVKDGHSVSIGETVNSMQTVVLSGHTDEDIGGVVRFMEFVAEVVRDFRKVGEPITVTDKQTPKGSLLPRRGSWSPVRPGTAVKQQPGHFGVEELLLIALFD